MIEHSFKIQLRDGRERQALLLEQDGRWGECSPIPGYPCDPVAARAAAEEAARGEWPAPVRASVPVNALVADDAFAPAELRGFESVKVKVGDPGDADRVARVREMVGPHVAIRVDANGAWAPDRAEERIRALSRYDIELVEEPVHGLEELAALRRKVAVPIAADESVRSLADARRCAALGAADAIVLKVQCCGGVHAALEWASEVGVPVIVSSMMETSIGIRAGLALAAALPELPYSCGLATAGVLLEDVTPEPLLPVDGVLALRELDVQLSERSRQ